MTAQSSRKSFHYAMMGLILPISAGACATAPTTTTYSVQPTTERADNGTTLPLERVNPETCMVERLVIVTKDVVNAKGKIVDSVPTGQTTYIPAAGQVANIDCKENQLIADVTIQGWNSQNEEQKLTAAKAISDALENADDPALNEQMRLELEENGISLTNIIEYFKTRTAKPTCEKQETKVVDGQRITVYKPC